MSTVLQAPSSASRAVIERVFTPGLAQVAYLIADPRAREAAVIDPRRDIEAYTQWAEARGFKITAILETHVHADFVSGARELAAATGATVYASRRGEQEFPHVPLDDGDLVTVGDLQLKALWTPGHTPEHIAFLLIDPAVREEPLAMFSGDLLFVGEVGRPDLLGQKHTGELAEHLFETIAYRLDPLPNDTIVYPGHTAGSSCGKKIGDAPHTSMGQERLVNYAFQYRQKDDFVEAIMTGMPVPPTYYPTMKRVNKIGPALLAELPVGDAMTPGEVETAIHQGALVIDARSESAFDTAHIPGAYYAGNTPDFVNWSGWLAPYDRKIVLVLDSDAAFDDARTELRRIGLDNVLGFLRGGMAAWEASGREIESLTTVDAATLSRRLVENDLTVVDVRAAAEWEEGHIPGAVHAYAGRLAQGMEMPETPGSTIALTCASGYRSRVAASLLQQRGQTQLINLDGGMDAWTAAGLPVERD